MTITDESRARVALLMKSEDPTAASAVNAILATSFVYRDMIPIVAFGKHRFEPDGQELEEWPGHMRGKQGWLMAPNYLSSVDDALELVRRVFDGERHTLTVETKPTFSAARILWRHGATSWHSVDPDKTARAIIFALMEVLDKNDPTKSQAE